MQILRSQREPVVERQVGLHALVQRLVEEEPAWRVVRAGSSMPMAREHLSDEWGQPPAEDYLVYKPAAEWREPAMKTRRDNEIQDALLSSAERWWLERHPDEDYVVIAAKSRHSGNVFRFRCRPSSVIVRWVQKRWEREQLLRAGLSRCSCIARDEMCPLCLEALMGVQDEYAAQPVDA